MNLQAFCECCQKPFAGSEQPCSCKTEEATLTSLGASAPDLGERYDVLAYIGKGGMASVYKVFDKTLGTVFAAKVMNEDLATEPVALKRFAAEAEAASSMTHGNIATVYSHGVSASNVPFLCMDLLDGETLESLLAREGKLSPRRAVEIFQQVTEALIHAHMKGVIHRDLKPSNIFLSKTSEGIELVKLVDFGIAKLEYQPEDSTRLTQTGALVGSPLYMSPEQCRGEKQDARSDIYSLGCVMYHSITGKPPFSGENPVKIVLQHVKQTPAAFSSIEDDTGISTALESCVMRCLTKDPKDRYQSADELLAQFHSLDYAGPNVAISAEARPAPIRRFVADLIDGCVLAGIMSVVGFVLLSGKPNVLAHFPQWQTALLGQYVSFMDPLTGVAVSFFLLAMLLFPAVFVAPLVLSNTADFFGSWGGLLLLTLAPLFYGLYCAICESSPLQGTLGQRALGLVVVDSSGKKISFARSLWRFVVRWFSPFIYLAALGTTPNEPRSGNVFRDTWDKNWRLSKYPQADEIAGAYVVQNQNGSFVVRRELYQFAGSRMPLAKLKHMQKRMLPELLLNSLIVSGVFYLLTPGMFAWLTPLILCLAFAPSMFVAWQMWQLEQQTKRLDKRVGD